MYLQKALTFITHLNLNSAIVIGTDDRFFPINYHLLITTMINVKMSVPVYKANEFGSLGRKADIQIAGDFDSVSEGYSFLRTQIDELLKQSNAENTLLLNLRDLEKEIANKERTLELLNRKIETANKERTLELLNRKIETAKRQFQRLQNFLERLGIDPGSYSLLISDGPIGSPVAVELEVDPIPFDSEGSSHEF